MQERLGNKAGIIIQKLVYVGQDAYMLDKERLHLRCFCLPYAWIRPLTSKMNYSHAVVDITWWKFLGTYLPGLFHVWFLVPVAESLTDVGIHGT